MESLKLKPYTLVADIYGYLMRFINYSEWAEYYYMLSKDTLKRDAHLLELAAGNCRLYSEMRTYFNNIIVSDLSAEMLRQSEVKNVDKVCCNMEILPFKRKFNMIYSAFDSINYLLTKKSLTSVFKEVYDILEKDGIFTFDVSLENNSIKNESHLNRQGSYKGIKYQQKSDYDRDSRIHTNKFIITAPSGTKFTEIHKQKIFPLEVYFELLIDSGFTVKQCYDAFSFNDATKKSERIQFVASKG